MKTCAKCGREYEDLLEKCPACAKRTKQYIIIGVVAVIVLSATLKFLFIF